MIYSIWVINKAGGLIYQRTFPPSPPPANSSSPSQASTGISPSITANEYLVLAGTLHGIHAITSKIAPVRGGGGLEVIESEGWRIGVRLTVTGIKFILISTLTHPNPDGVLQKIYEAYADTVMKNPFYTLEMPINVSLFDSRVAALVI